MTGHFHMLTSCAVVLLGHALLAPSAAAFFLSGTKTATVITAGDRDQARGGGLSFGGFLQHTNDTRISLEPIRVEPLRLPPKPDIGPDGESRFEEPRGDTTWQEDVRRFGGQFWRGMQKADLMAGIKHGADEMHQDFMPDYHYDRDRFIKSCTLYSVSIIWFVVYFMYLYHPASGRLAACSLPEDVCGSSDPTSKSSPSRTPSGRMRDFTPDLVLVFHHPDHDYSDKDTGVYQETVRRLKLKGDKWSRVNEEMQFKTPDDVARTMTAERRKAKKFTAADIMLVNEVDCNEAHSTKGQVRSALMRDLCESLDELGFDVKAFTSVDDDEIFVCISVTSEEVLLRYVEKSDLKMQIQQYVVANLGIAQDALETSSSPPYVRYDPALVNVLHKEGVLDGPGNAFLYKTFPDSVIQNCLVGDRDRLAMILKEVSSRWDVNAAVHEGFLVDWYVAHNMRQVRRFLPDWARWSKLCDLTFTQPLALINEYFGSRVTFQFAWNGFYCKALLALLPVALLFWATTDYKSHNANRKDSLAYCLVILTWAQLVSILWEREEEFLLKIWNMDPTSAKVEFSEHESFQGFPMPSPIDDNLEEQQYPTWLADVRIFISMFTAIAFCAVELMIILSWSEIFALKKSSVGAWAALTAQIKCTEQIYKFLSVKLTDFENHKRQDSHFDSYLVKAFLFQFVYNYWALLEIGVIARYSGTCPKIDGVPDCLGTMRYNLVTMQMIILMCFLGGVIGNLTLTQALLWYETYQMRRQGKTEEEQERPFVEIQSKYPTHRTYEQVDGLVQLIISLGYVLLFGSLAGIMVPFCFVVFSGMLRSNAVYLALGSKRTSGEMYGIGAVKGLVSFLTNIGIVLSAVLVVNYGIVFAGAGRLTKLSGVLIIIAAVRLVRDLVSWMLPPNSYAAELLDARRAHVCRALNERYAKSHTAPVDVAEVRSSSPSVLKHSKTAVLGSNWDNLQKGREIMESGSPLGLSW